MGEATALVLFGRLPVEGQVKTRLAAGSSNAAACSFYRACCEHLLRTTSGTKAARRVFFCSDAAQRDSVVDWVCAVVPALEVESQVGDPDLGARMAAALQLMLDQGATKAVIVGTDIPDLTAEVIDAAFRALDDHEMVVGPAEDGGYYLLGLRRVPHELFERIEWSTSRVLKQTLQRASESGLSVAPGATLPTLADIDTVQDVRAWLQRSTESHPLHAPVAALFPPAASYG